MACVIFPVKQTPLDNPFHRSSEYPHLRILLLLTGFWRERHGTSLSEILSGPRRYYGSKQSDQPRDEDCRCRQKLRRSCQRARECCSKGYALALDMTAREIQSSGKASGLPWTVAKGQDTFTPISSMQPKAAIEDPHNLELWLKVDNESKQKGFNKIHDLQDPVSYKPHKFHHDAS